MNKTLKLLFLVLIITSPLWATGLAALTASRHLAKLRVKVAADKEQDRNRVDTVWWQF